MTNVPYLKPVPASGERPKIKSVRSTVRDVLELAKRDPSIGFAQSAMLIYVNAEGSIDMIHSGIDQPERNWLLDKAKQTLMLEDPE